MLRTTLVVSTLALLACGGSDKRVARPDSSGGDIRTVGQMPSGSSVEKATGDVREAMLALKRVHFAFDRYDLAPAARAALADAAEKLRELADVSLYVQGHADERGTAEYNMALGERRAEATARHLARLGIDRNRLAVVSYGEEVPLIAGGGENVWSKNRRVEFQVMRGDVRIVLEEGTTVPQPHAQR